jgi:hypothetical protein
VADNVDRTHARASILESVSDTARVLLTAAVLTATALAVYLWRLTRLDPTQPERLIGELRLAQWAAIALATVAAVSIGLAIAHETAPFGTIEITAGLALVVVAALVLLREPRDALLLAASGFLVHAMLNIAHRPGALNPIAPPWYVVGCAIYDLFFAAVCYWARRRP